MFLLKSFIFSIFSPQFYKEAVGKGLKKAFLVFFLFILVVSLISTVSFLFSFGRTITRQPFETWDFPDVTVENGIMTSVPAKPYVHITGRQYFGLDCTGSLTEIPVEYSTGVLFTKDSIIFRSEDYSEDIVNSYDAALNELQMDSFSLNKDSLSEFCSTAGIVIMVISPFFIFISKFVGTLISVLIIGLLGSILFSMMGIHGSFRHSFIIAMYAAIPVCYLSFIISSISWVLNKVGLSFSMPCCLFSLLFDLVKWGVFWTIGAIGVGRAH